MTALNKQALRQLATDAHELGIIKRYTKGIEANKRFAAIATPLTFLALLDELDENYRLTAERDALRENIGGDNTRAAADIYFQLVEECEIPPGGSLVGYVDDIKERMSNAENHSAELDNSLCELRPGTQYMDPPDGGSVTPLEQVRRMVAEYRERIEELESRTVTVKLPADYRNDDGSINDDMFNTCEVVGAFREALAAAGIGVKGE